MLNGATDPNEYLIEASQRLVDSATYTLSQLTQQTIVETVNERVIQIVHDILSRFTIPSTHRVYGTRIPDMSPALYAHFNGRITKKETKVKHKGPWKCPPFSNLPFYYVQLCLEGRNVIPFGILSEDRLTLNADGRVDVHEGSFQGEGTMTIPHDMYVKQHVDFFVLGHIEGTGTAVLVDTEKNVWLYNPPEAADKYVCRSTGSVMLIMKGGDVMLEDTCIDSIEKYENVTVVFDEDETDVGPYRL